jgi:hypothetical protein
VTIGCLELLDGPDRLLDVLEIRLEDRLGSQKCGSPDRVVHDEHGHQATLGGAVEGQSPSVGLLSSEREGLSNACGILFPAGDAEALAGAIAPWIRDEVLRREQGRAALERVWNRHSWERTMARLEDFYVEVDARRPARCAQSAPRADPPLLTRPGRMRTCRSRDPASDPGRSRRPGRERAAMVPRGRGS